MYGEDFLYRLEGFTPPNERGSGRYGFGIKLNLDFAKKAFGNELPEPAYEGLIKRGERVVGAIFPNEGKYLHEPYMFTKNDNGKPASLRGKDTFLANSFIVPGNACSLVLGWGEQELITIPKSYKNYVEYSSHNVDSMEQSYALLSLFTTWFEATDATLYEDK